MREAEVQQAFVQHLLERGWDVSTQNADHIDVVARRGTERIVAEVKGHTSSPGLNVDTLYGQLLRRMDAAAESRSETRYAAVVPETLRAAAERVPESVRAAMHIDVWSVDDLGVVRTPVRGTTGEAGRPHDEETVGDWRGRLPQEGVAARRHRRHQGEWRTTQLRWPAGAPTAASTRSRYPTLPNYLAHEHLGQTAEDAGINLSEGARDYTRDRLPVVEALNGLATRDRLYRNLLSSQPLAFSIAGELRAQPAAAARVLGDLTELPVVALGQLTGADEVVPPQRRQVPRYQPLERYTLDGIEAEWSPPRWAHTGDQSGFDVAACVDLGGTRRALLSVEVKYIDSFSAEPVRWERYRDHLAALGLDRPACDALVKHGASQVLRQAMITNSVVHTGLVPGVGPEGRVDEAVVVVLCRHDDSKAHSVARALDDALPVRVTSWTHQAFLDRATEEPELAAWATTQRARYCPS